MRNEDLINRKNKSELQYADSSSTLFVERHTIDNADSVDVVDMSSASNYILDLSTALDTQDRELTTSQSEVQNLLGETNALLSEYNMSVKVMKDKLDDRKIKLRKTKA